MLNNPVINCLRCEKPGTNVYAGICDHCDIELNGQQFHVCPSSHQYRIIDCPHCKKEVKPYEPNKA